MPSLAFRTRIVLVVLAVAMAPLILLGLWITGQSARSGEALLRERLDATLDETAESVQRRWIPYRSELLDVVQQEEVRDALRSAAGAGSRASPDAPASLRSAVGALDGAIAAVTIRDSLGSRLWRIDRSGAGRAAAFGAPLTVRIPIHAVGGRRLGTLEAGVQFQALGGSSQGTTVTGGVLSARDPRTGAVLLPVPFDPALVGRERFRWNEQVWIARSRQVVEPRVTLVAAAPLAPFAGPFREEARRSAWILLGVAAVGILAVVALTGRLTASLRRLATAAERVSAGDLSRTVDLTGDDEVGKVARAFNTMVESLRGTLRQLAERESLAAVNEFAASLAHEVRNPLTSIQLDLQEVEEELPPGSEVKRRQGEVVEKVRRLDRTIEGALETARSGRIDPRETDLLEPIRRAVDSARPHFEETGAELAGPERERPVLCRADPDALAQVFLNLLLNAAEAAGPDEATTVEVEAEGDPVLVRVRDEGHGIAEEDLERIFDPFFTTRAGGTGVGLAVARRIVRAHRGEIRVRSTPGEGTTVIVELPRTEPSRSSG